MIKKIILIFLLLIILISTVLFYNLDWVVQKGIQYAGVQVDKVEKISIGHWKLSGLSYQVDEKNKLTIKETKIDFLDIDVEASQLHRNIQALSSRIHIENKNLQYGNYKIKEVSYDVQKTKGPKLNIENIYISDFGKKNLGVVYLDFNDLNTISVEYKDINLNNLIHYFDSTLNLWGHIDVKAMIKKDDIQALVTGRNLTLKGFKVDEVINNFLDSRSLGIIDVAGFVALGPIGLLYTSAASLGQTLNGFRGGETKFTQININIGLKKDILTLDDVAFATVENMVTVAGQVNIKEETFEDVLISILDEEYCPKLQQKLKGTFKDPDYSKTSAFVNTATAPLTNLTSSTLNLVGVTKCRPVYQGVVKFPVSQ